MLDWFANMVFFIFSGLQISVIILELNYEICLLRLFCK